MDLRFRDDRPVEVTEIADAIVAVPANGAEGYGRAAFDDSELVTGEAICEGDRLREFDAHAIDDLSGTLLQAGEAAPAPVERIFVSGWREQAKDVLRLSIRASS